jgi:hypothetical protein
MVLKRAKEVLDVGNPYLIALRHSGAICDCTALERQCEWAIERLTCLPTGIENALAILNDEISRRNADASVVSHVFEKSMEGRGWPLR